MILYHGTNCDFAEIDISKCSPNKDFGQGFYLTDIPKQAEYMAVRRVRQSGEGVATVLAYEFDELMLHNKAIRVRTFEKPTEAWATFVLKNRKDEDFSHGYDIVVGSVADDGVALQLRRYEEKLISMRTLVRELTYRKLNRQYCFCTELAISKLKRV